MLELVKDDVAGDPQNGQRWIKRSLSKIQSRMVAQGYELACGTIGRLLRQNDLSPKSNVKRLTPKPHPDRDRQFVHIQQLREVFVKLGQPTVSVDTKKKELIGNFFQAGQTWCEEATPVNMHDFPSAALGKAVPYGVYDVQNHKGHVFVGQSADTPEFAVDNLVDWWQETGRWDWPEAFALLVLADAGGSDGYRPRRWKQQLQIKLADPFNLAVFVAHYPSGASKWNPIEHRLFSQISQTWAGTPLTSFDRVVDAIHHTTTSTGLIVDATLVTDHYETGLSVSDAEMASLNLVPHATCPQWNYTIYPRNSGSYF